MSSIYLPPIVYGKEKQQTKKLSLKRKITCNIPIEGYLKTGVPTCTFMNGEGFKLGFSI